MATRSSTRRSRRKIQTRPKTWFAGSCRSRVERRTEAMRGRRAAECAQKKRETMNILRRILALVGLATMLYTAPSTASADEPDASLQGDHVCTRCHDETESRPVLAIYKTAHGVKADSRTPGCQSCHGASEAHVTNPKGSSTRPLVDVDFNPRGSTAPELQAQTCLTCHEAGQRVHWVGSEHNRSGLVCTSC